MEVWCPDFQGQCGEPGSGADVEDAKSPAQAKLGRGTLQSHTGVCGEEVAGQEEGLAEVTSYDFFFFADGGQVDAGIPAE